MDNQNNNNQNGQPSAADIQAQQQAIQEQNNAEGGKKVAKAAAEVAGEYFAPGVGGQVVGAIANTPMGDAILSEAGNRVAQIPGIGDQIGKMNQDGSLDAATSAIGAIAGDKMGAGSGATGAAGSAMAGGTGQGATVASPMQANRMNPGDNLQGVAQQSTPTPTEGATPEAETPQESPEPAPAPTESTNSSTGDSSAGYASSLSDNKVISYFKRHPDQIPMALAVIGVFLIVFFMLMVVVAYAGEESANNSDSNSSGTSGGGATSLSSANATETSSCSQMSKPIDEVLKASSSSLDDYNQYIVNEVHKAGVGTREGVVAAALAATSGLCQNFNTRLPYTMGGAHPSNFYGLKADWGTSINGGKGAMRHGYGPYYFEGPDCSGFVGWSIYNGGYNAISLTASQFGSLGTVHDTTSYVGKPGDVLFNSHHVVMIVGEQGSNYLIAEASSGENGTRVTTVAKTTNAYKVVDMSSYYNDESKKNVANYPAATSTSAIGDSSSSQSSNGKIIVIDPGHGKSSSAMSDAEKTSAGFTQNNGQWGEWRFFKTGTWGEEWNDNSCPRSGDCWYPIGNGDRDTEPEITLGYANATKKYLEQKGYTVRMTRTSNNENPSFNVRAAYAFKDKNSNVAPDAAAIVCLHSNAGGGKGSAYLELGGSYHQKYIPSNYVESSNRLGKLINDEIVSQTSLTAYNSGVISSNKHMILFQKSPVPVGYMEIGFYDAEVSLLRQETDKIGKAVADGIDKWMQQQ